MGAEQSYEQPIHAYTHADSHAYLPASHSKLGRSRSHDPDTLKPHSHDPDTLKPHMAGDKLRPASAHGGDLGGSVTLPLSLPHAAASTRREHCQDNMYETLPSPGSRRGTHGRGNLPSSHTTASLLPKPDNPRPANVYERLRRVKLDVQVPPPPARQRHDHQINPAAHQLSPAPRGHGVSRQRAVYCNQAVLASVLTAAPHHPAPGYSTLPAASRPTIPPPPATNSQGVSTLPRKLPPTPHHGTRHRKTTQQTTHCTPHCTPHHQTPPKYEKLKPGRPQSPHAYQEIVRVELTSDGPVIIKSPKQLDFPDDDCEYDTISDDLPACINTSSQPKPGDVVFGECRLSVRQLPPTPGEESSGPNPDWSTATLDRHSSKPPSTLCRARSMDDLLTDPPRHCHPPPPLSHKLSTLQRLGRRLKWRKQQQREDSSSVRSSSSSGYSTGSSHSSEPSCPTRQPTGQVGSQLGSQFGSLAHMVRDTSISGRGYLRSHDPLLLGTADSPHRGDTGLYGNLGSLGYGQTLDAYTQNSLTRHGGLL